MVCRIRNLGCRVLTCSVLALAVFSLALPASANEYDPQTAGYPLRIIAYGVHPIGVVLDLLIFRPAHWIGSYEPIALFFGHEPYTR